MLAAKDVGLLVGVGLRIQVDPIGCAREALLGPGASQPSGAVFWLHRAGLGQSVEGLVEWAHDERL